MKLTGTFEYLGIDSFVGTKDPSQTYYSAALMQGTEVTKIFLKPEDVQYFNGINRMESVYAELDIKIGQKTYISLVSVKKATAKVA